MAEDIKLEAEETKETEVDTEVTEEAKETAEAETSEENTSEENTSEENTAEAEEDVTEEQNVDEKKGLFKKKKDKRDEQIEELNDKIKRQMAEFDNFRKRTDKEKSQMFDMGARTIIEKILPVVDNFERGLAAVPEEQRDDAFVDGMDKIYKQLMTELDGIGVKAIECVGKEFDPEYHNAVMQVENEKLEAGTVASELQKGYMYKDTVIRHSMVSVVQ